MCISVCVLNFTHDTLTPRFRQAKLILLGPSTCCCSACIGPVGSTLRAAIVHVGCVGRDIHQLLCRLAKSDEKENTDLKCILTSKLINKKLEFETPNCGFITNDISFRIVKLTRITHHPQVLDDVLPILSIGEKNKN